MFSKITKFEKKIAKENNLILLSNLENYLLLNIIKMK